MWYPENKKDLDFMLEDFLNQETKLKISKKIEGIIVPHAGYFYSGKIAAKAYRLFKNSKSNYKKAIIFGPSHYIYLRDLATHNQDFWQTPLGKIKIFNLHNLNNLRLNIEKEHSIGNQVPFVQKIGLTEICPLMVGEIDNKKAEEVAEKIFGINALKIFSTDLSHFFTYNEALEIDRKSIEIIQDLDFKNLEYLDACGKNAIKILFFLCKKLKSNPKLIDYINSGDVTGNKNSVVGYASFYF